MKWFKHISDSLADPFIGDLMDKYGEFGYFAFFAILEIYAREFKIKEGWKLDVNLRFIRNKMQLRNTVRIKRFLSDEQVTSKWEIMMYKNSCQERVSIYIPKFVTLLDEHTRNKLRQYEKKSEVTHESLMPKDKDKDKDKEEDTSVPFPKLPTKDELENASIIKLKEKINIITKQLYDEKIFPKVNMWVNTMRKKKINDRTILHTLTRCYLKKTFDKGNAWGYCTKIISVEDGNYNEKDYRRTQG